MAARVDVKYGAINEKLPGTAHLLEHVIFGNTERFPESGMSDLAAQFHHIKPTVNLEWISCKAEMLPDRLERFLAYTADALFAPRFEPDHIRREKMSVIQEIASTETQARSIKRMLYGADHPLMYGYQGTPESISRISASDLRSFHRTGVHPNLMSIILVGDIPPQSEVWIERYFGSAKPRSVTRRTPPAVPKLKKQRIIDQDVPQLKSGTTDIELTWNTGVTLASPEVYATRAMNHFLGGHVHYARLRQRLVEEMPVTYTIASHYDPGMYSSEMVVKAVTATEPDRFTNLIFDVFQSMRSEPVSERLLAAFYDHWRYERRALAQMNEAMRDMIFDEIRTGISAEQKERGYRNVTASDILEASRRHLPDPSGEYLLVVSRGIRE